MSEWRYEIQYGPEGEANYAWVYCGKEMVATMKTHRAKEVVSALSAALSGMAELVKVKPLEWKDEGNGDFTAQSEVGSYHISLPASFWSALMPDGEILSGYHTHTEAKAAAQADYEHRILSALATPPASGLREENRWQPIGMAPKTGETIIVRLANGEVFSASWHVYGSPGWHVATDIGFVNPTHWMPLPAPPLQTEGK